MRSQILVCGLLASFFLNAQEKKNVKLVSTYLNKAAILYHKEDYVQALKLSKNALSISLTNEDNYHLALSYNMIGTIYNEFSQSDRAINYYAKGLAYANKAENDTLRLWLTNSLGNVYYYNDISAEKSIFYYSKSLKFAEKINDSVQITYTRLNMASVYFDIDRIDYAMSYVKPLENYIDLKGSAESKITYLDLVGKYYSNKSLHALSEKSFLKAIALAKEAKLNSQLKVLYNNIFQHYLQVNDQVKAKLYQDLISESKENSEFVDELDTIEKVAVQIELDEYKFQFERIELKNEVQNQKIQLSRIIIIGACIILFILLILVYTLYRNNSIRKKSNKKLSIANRDLIQANQAAEENSILKSQFIATVSHELRTPLYGVIGLTNIILEENKNNCNHENLNSLRFSAEYLLALVNDLLEINKAEEKNIFLRSEPFNIREQLEIFNKSLSFIAESNENELIIVVDKEIPEIIVADELRLSQILMNLMSNALKFTEKGTVKMEVSLLSKNDFKCEIEFKITDTGIGIKAEDQEKIFDKFVQLERKKADYQGTGLGLSIVKKLVELFGGKIKVESEENQGTIFLFTISLEYGNKKFVKSNTNKLKSSVKKDLRFLVVEDNKINQIVTKKIIEQHKFDCTVVESGYEALNILKSTSFDIILMDINMPLLDGYETSKMIRAYGIKTPIIALTAFDRTEVESKAKESGITDVIIKPFKSEILFEVIDNLVP